MTVSDSDFKALRRRVEPLESLPGRVTEALNSVKKLEESFSQATWMQRNPVLVWLVSFILPIVAICLALFFGVLTPLENYAKLQIGTQLSDSTKPQNDKLSEIEVKIAEISGKLEVYDPMLREYWRDRLKKSAQLSPRDFKSSLGELSKTVTAATEAKIAVDPLLVSQIGKRVFDLAAKTPDQASYWQAALSFVDYRSALNPSPVPPAKATPLLHATTHYTIFEEAGPPVTQAFVYGDVPRDQAAVYEHIGQDLNKNNPRGDAFLIVQAKRVILDGMDIRNVVFENVHIVYGGGPLKMENIFFVNCTFELPQTRVGQELAETVLNHPSVVFSAG
jgi:hypothetical protein